MKLQDSAEGGNDKYQQLIDSDGEGRVSFARNQSFGRVLQQLWRSLSGPWELLYSWTTGDVSASLSWSALHKSMLLPGS